MANSIEWSINQAGSVKNILAGAGRIYVYLNGLLVALIDGNTVSHVETDHLGRPELVLQDNAIKWHAENTAFGRTTVSSGVTLDVGFPGQLYDSETGLWYNWHRYYDASIGRYIQSDPIGLEGGMNTYAYAGSNPVSFVDPSGLTSVTGSFYRGSGGQLTVGFADGKWFAQGGMGWGLGIGFSVDPEGKFDRPKDIKANECANSSEYFFGTKADVSAQLGFHNWGYSASAGG